MPYVVRVGLLSRCSMTIRQLMAGFAVAGLLLGGATAASAAPVRKKAARTHAQTRKSFVDLNSASKARLAALPGVGDAGADKIIAGRPYTSRNDLVSMNVLPPEAFEKIKGRVVARHAAAGKRAARRKTGTATRRKSVQPK